MNWQRIQRLALVAALAASSACTSAGPANSDGGADARASEFPRPTREQLIQALVLWSSCSLDRTVSIGQSTFSLIARLYDPFGLDEFVLDAEVASERAAFACVLNATSCADVERCASRGFSEDSCGTEPWACRGDTLLLCSRTPQAVTAIDCTLSNQRCAPTRTAFECVSSASGTCTGGKICDGRRVVECSPLRRASIDCARIDPGGRCVTDTTGDAVCQFSGDLCNTSQSACRGNLRVYCSGRTGERREASVDCAGSPFFGRCRLGGPVYPCEYTNGMCSVLDRDQCDGNTLVFCGPGGTARVDCQALGFGRCQVFENAARCVP